MSLKFGIQVVLRNVQGIKSMLVLSQLITMEKTLNIPLLAGYTYHFPKQQFSFLKLFRQYN